MTYLTKAGLLEAPHLTRGRSPLPVLRQGLALELLQLVQAASPSFFERLVVELLVAMGYRGSEEDAGIAKGRSGDHGIDSIIKQDRLGPDIVYIVLIDGEGLAELMVELGAGVTAAAVYGLKRVDQDYSDP
jgi:restriction endonuclease Mrr